MAEGFGPRPRGHSCAMARATRKRSGADSEGTYYTPLHVHE